MNREPNQRMGLEKLVRKLPTSIFDMPSLQRYEARREKMLPRTTPIKPKGACLSPNQFPSSYVFIHNCCIFVDVRLMLNKYGGHLLDENKALGSRNLSIRVPMPSFDKKI